MSDRIQHKRKQYTWSECICDLCGNWRRPGFCADVWTHKDGSKIVTLGGGWEFYLGFEPPSILDEDVDSFIAACEVDGEMEWLREHRAA